MTILLWQWLSALLITSIVIPANWNTPKLQAPTQQDVFVVNSLTDEVDSALGNGQCATIAGMCTLRAAIQEANALPGKNTVQLTEGIYQLIWEGNREDNAVTGDLDITDDLILTGVNREYTVIDANAIDRIIQVFGAINVTIQNLTLRNGVTSARQGGGAVAIEGNAQVTLKDVIIQDNTTGLDGRGGAIFNAEGKLEIDNSVIKDNIARQTGGGIFNAGTLNVKNSSINGNRAFYDAGGLYNEGQATLTNLLIARNQANAKGGGIYNNGALRLSLVVLSRNDAKDNDGGIYATGKELYINNSVFSDNTKENCEFDSLTVSGTRNIDSKASCKFSDSFNLTGTSTFMDLLTEFDKPLFTSQEIYHRYWEEVNQIQREQKEFLKTFDEVQSQLNKFEKELESLLFDLIPVVGEAKTIYELFTGKDYITGEPKSTSLSVIDTILALLPVISHVKEFSKLGKLIDAAEFSNITKLFAREVMETPEWWNKPMALFSAINRYRRLRSVIDMGNPTKLIEFIIYDVQSPRELSMLTIDLTKSVRKYMLMQWVMHRLFQAKQPQRVLLPDAGRIVDHLQEDNTAWKIVENNQYTVSQFRQDLKDFRRVIEIGDYTLKFFFDTKPTPEIIQAGRQADVAICWPENQVQCPELAEVNGG